MKAMVLDGVRDLREESEPLRLADVEVPHPGEGEVLLKVHACGVCHTELDEIEGRTAPPSYPVIPGHEIVGTVETRGEGVSSLEVGDRVGVGWIFSSCGSCEYCNSGNQNLCLEFKATGRDADGGYAEYMTVPEISAHRVPDVFSDVEAAPLMCAGAIGYRSLRLTGIQNGQNLGLTGFGGSGHLVLKMVGYRYPDTDVYVFARNPSERQFAHELGAVWAGDTADTAPVGLHAIIDTTPAWKPVVEAMRNLRPGGRLVINAIRKESLDQDYLMRLDYAEHLWMEREIKSVANVAHGDISGFLELAAEMGSKPETGEYALEDANRALLELKGGNVRGAKVLRMF
ncbi:alcohol dehydrogenase catalytic domain-containing protein [Candidatus Fermentibacteria bacterium]|nr:alcohol dehydrogenase catalytic domain-containing protein [Candidatus Fermentibacteria bacterium]